MTTSKQYAKMSESQKKKEDWMNSKWRPMMGWMYMATCITDFIIFPILWSILQSISHGQVTSQWQPLTLQGAGLYHIAMGAVLGLTAWGRTQEKLNGVNNSSFSSMGTNNFASTFSSSPSFGSGYNSSSMPQTDSWGTVSNSSRGKPMPYQPPMPER